MRADRRHELKENDLAHALEVAKVYLHENGKRLGLAVTAVIVIFAVVTVAVRTRAANIEDAWRRRSELSYKSADEARQSLEKLSAMVKESADIGFALSGLVDLGMQSLRYAQESAAPPDPDFNALARQAFEDLLARFPANPLAAGMAHSGLATVAENAFVLDQNPSHKEEARRHLSAIVDNASFQGLPFYRRAADRLAAIDRTFSVVRFAAAPPPPAPSADLADPAEPAAGAAMPEAAPAAPPEVKMQRVRVNPDGTVEPIEEP
ncbi:MAG: hypothetical protein HY763_07535 [Planctomycetes bacterium]|nr:hypothetical protein [Planctomycetota bacterium]